MYSVSLAAYIGADTSPWRRLVATTLAEILPAAAARHGDRTALVIDKRQLSFRELDAQSNRVANGLVALGVKPGDRVGLFGANNCEWVIPTTASQRQGPC